MTVSVLEVTGCWKGLRCYKKRKTFRKIQDCGWLFFSISNHVNKFVSGLKTHKLFLCILCIYVCVGVGVTGMLMDSVMHT